MAVPMVGASFSASAFVINKIDAIQTYEVAESSYWNGDQIGGNAQSAEASSLGQQADLAVALALVFAGAAYAAKRFVYQRVMNRDNIASSGQQPTSKNI
jgi:hypothetical protein